MSTVKFEVNGKKEAIEGGTSLKGYLDSKGINSNSVACELNLKIIRRAELDKVTLKEGDTLEIIRMIGGG